MKVREFLNLVGIFEIDSTDPYFKTIGAYNLYIPVMNFIEVMEKNGLEVKKRKGTAWGVAQELSSFSEHLGVDEAHDIVKAWCKQYNIRPDVFPTTIPVPANLSRNISADEIEKRVVDNKTITCDTNISNDMEEKQKKAIDDMHKYGLK